MDVSAPAELVLDEALIRAQLARVLASACFGQSDRLRQFLRFIVDEALAGRSDQIKEYSIGLSVYGKPVDYDPKTDATVRGEASRLRSRLCEYYAREGARDSLEVQLRKGGYAPTFRARTPADQNQAPRSVAILPFCPIVRDGAIEDAHVLGLAIADAVIGRIGAWGDLVVRPTSAIRRFMEGRCDALEAARRLQTDAIAEGHYQLIGNRMRVSVQLLESATGRHLWTGQYDLAFDDLFAVQDVIAEQLAHALRGPLKGPGASTRPAVGISAQAYEHFSRGRHYLPRVTPQSCSNAIAEFQAAIAADPKFANAHAYLALSYLQQAELFQTTYEAITSPAKKAIEDALALCPDLPEGYVALGTLQFRCLWDWDAAETAFRHALRLNPNSFDGCLEYAALLDCLARFDEALDLKRTALRQDPASPLVHVWLSLNHWFRREYDEAIGWSRAALRLDPHYLLAYERIAAQFYKIGAHEDWAEHLLRAFALWSGDNQWIAAQRLNAHAVRPETLIDALVDRNHAQSSQGAAWFSMQYAELRQIDMAFACLEGAFQQRLSALVYLKVDPAWDNLRDDPRFDDLLRRMKLV